MKATLAFSAASFLALLAGCAGAPLVPQADGTRTTSFSADRDTVYHAVVAGLRAEGYEAFVADPIRLRVEARAGNRVAIVQGEERGNRIHVRIGLTYAEARDFERLYLAIKKALGNP